MLGYLRIGLADAGGLDDDHVESGELAHCDRGFQRPGDRHVGGASGHRPHVHASMWKHVHPDPVAQEGASAPTTGWIDRQDGDRALVVTEDQPPDQLVGQRGFACPACSGDPDDRRAHRLGLAHHHIDQV